MNAANLKRLAALDRQEAVFRLRGATRKWRERVSMAVAPPRWDLARLTREMREIADSPGWTAARAAAAAGDAAALHRGLARHFAERSSAFPLDSRDVASRARMVAAAFPGAAADAARRADAILRGEYDLLGYERISIASPIDWHRDPVHGRRAPLAHWAAVPYLDPTAGDHKIVWELNRHQHWLALGRAHALTGNREYYRAVRDQLLGWLDANPPRTGTNWASMLELAFRSLSWLWAIAFFAGAAHREGDDAPWLGHALAGLTAQLAHVQRNLSLYFSPNTHLTGEALALYVAGSALPELASSASWRETGRAVLLREATAQVLADGGHAEMSGHYHRYSTDFYLLALSVARRAGDAAAAPFEASARGQARYLRTITDDRGIRPATADDDGGQLFPICGRPPDDCRDTLAVAAALLDEPALTIGNVPEEALWLCGADAAELADTGRRAVWPSTALAATGYYVSRTPEGDHLLFDAGPHGFLNGGHAHADALSIVLTAAGRPLFVDPGTATYTMDPELRDRFRSTAMHNTLVLDGRAQSVPDGPFHWRSRASARADLWRTLPGEGHAARGCDYVEGTHDGYLPRRHTRAVLALHGAGWWILDHVLGEGDANIEVYWHLHPSWQPAARGASVALRHPDGTSAALASTAPLAVVPAGADPLAVWSPAYGRVEPAPVVVARTRVSLPYTIATFVPAAAAPDEPVELERVALAQTPPGWHAGAWRAAWSGGSMVLLAAIEPSGVTGDAAASPAAPWGTAGLTTDARVAALLDRRSSRDAVLVNGAAIWHRGIAIARVDRQAEIVSVPVRTDLASPVHEHAPAEMGTH